MTAILCSRKLVRSQLIHVYIYIYIFIYLFIYTCRCILSQTPEASLKSCA